MRLALTLLVSLALCGCGVRGAPKPPKDTPQPAPSTAPDAGVEEEP